ncbi:MAG: DUF1573 domain-containing protein [Prevotella sp.]
MLPIDSLIVIGLSTLSLGTINEADGKQEREFWLHNVGTEAVSIVQGYTSCGCVKLHFPLGETILPGDSVRTVLSFDPKGKGGEFYERGTIVYGQSRKRLDIAMEGVCITSEETLMRQFPVRINDDIRISTNHFDVGVMNIGEKKTRHVAILHRDEDNRSESVAVTVEADSNLHKGVNRVKKIIETVYKNKKIAIEILFDILIK